MPGPDPTHWLHRLSAPEWLAAARTELFHCDQALGRRAWRTGITHARRAAGMACNAVLAKQPDLSWGRSYMDHLTAVSADGVLPPDVRDAAGRLLATPPRQPELIPLGKTDTTSLQAARIIVDWATGTLEGTDQPS